MTDADQDQPNWGDGWVWVAVAPITQLTLHAVIVKRTQPNAQRFIEGLAAKLSGQTPLFTSDELSHYQTALAQYYSSVIPAPPTGKRGRPKSPMVQIDSQLHYATIHKSRHNGKVVKVERRIVFGKEQDINTILAQSPVSHTINTAYVERNNLNLCQHSRRLTRKTNGFSKVKHNLHSLVILVMAYYNFVLSHGSLKIKGQGERTPAMADGITDHQWSMIELLTYRIPDN